MSSTSQNSLHLRVFLLATIASLLIAPKPALVAQSNIPGGAPSAQPSRESNVAQLFQQGGSELQHGNFTEAERLFRQVLAIDPNSAGAYANLGVISMRRKQWKTALPLFQKAEALAPQIAGIRLNIGLAYYRQNDFRSAIAPFESVVKDAPDSAQARHLLGLCYFFTERYADAVTTLQPLWDQQSNDLNYLYALGIAANKSANKELEERALGRLVEIGQNSGEFHLLMGKAHINREEYDEAIQELQLASKTDPKLPFVHFNLGLAYLKKQDLESAKAEFLKDSAIEPDLADNYDQLGLIDYLQLHDAEAERNLRKAIRLNPQGTSAHYQLGRVLQRQHKYADSLTQLDAALRLDPNGQSIHYVRGQVLREMGRMKEAQAEMTVSNRILNEERGQRQKELETRPLPNPELTREPQ